MGRIKRLDGFRFVGTRDDMTVYDCDDPADFDALSGRIESEDLIGHNLVQTFGPDTEAEARNRGYRPR